MGCLRVRNVLAVLSTAIACGGQPNATDHPTPPPRNVLAPRPFARCTNPSGADAGSDAGTAAPVSDADLVVASLRPEFRRCYQTGLNVDPVMQGCVIMQALISPDGEVTSNHAIRREGLSPDVEACLVDVVKTAHFAPRGGGVSTLHIPVTFLIP